MVSSFRQYAFAEIGTGLGRTSPTARSRQRIDKSPKVSFARQPQCDETYVASANAAGTAKLSRIRFVSAAGVKPNNRLKSLLNWDGLV